MIKVTSLFLIFLVTSSSVNETPLTEKERKHLLDYLVKTQDRLIKDVKGLTPLQLNFKPDSTRWSVAECVEHITVTEKTGMDRVMQAMKLTADASNRSKVTVTDEQVLKRYTDRSDKRKTSESLQPTSRFGSFEATVDEFLKKRNANIEYIKNSQDDFRNRITTFAYGTVDLYQCILGLAAHSERHIVQLEEVMADPNFPK